MIRNSVQVAENGQNKICESIQLENICGHAFRHVLEFGDKKTLKLQVVTLNFHTSYCHGVRKKPLVKVRYAAGILPFCLWRAWSQREKGCVGLKWRFSHKLLFLKIMAVIHASLACGHFSAYTEGPGRL